MSVNADKSERKRARTEDDLYSNMPALSDPEEFNYSPKDLRAMYMLHKITILLLEFPEFRFMFDIDFMNLHENVLIAIEKYAVETETQKREEENKKRKAQHLMNYENKNLNPLYSLPDEVLNNCLSYVGKGYYGVVALVSKKLNETYKEEFGQETAYLEMATSVKLSNYCLRELCKNLEEKDEMFKAAAVNGNVDILQAAVKDGHDLFPLVVMKKEIVEPSRYNNLEYENDHDGYHEEGPYREYYYADDDDRKYSWKPQKVKLWKIVERGHLHVLKYLHEELHYFSGLQRYIKPAIQYGQLEFLEWLSKIGIMKDDSLRIGYINDYDVDTDLDFCECAIKSGNVESFELLMKMGYEIQNGLIDDFLKYVIKYGDVNMLKCLQNWGYDFNDRYKIALIDAIKSKSVDMIQYCFEAGFDDFSIVGVQKAIKEAKNVEVYRKMHELGYEFGEMKKWYIKYRFEDYFDIIKFLRSISVSWDDGIMKDIVEYGTLEMIQYAHKDGCPWTGKEYNELFALKRRWSMEKFKYLTDNGCTVDYEYTAHLRYDLKRKKDFALLDYFVGKNSIFDNELFKECFESWNPWFEGIPYLLEKCKDVPNFKSLEEVFQELQEFNKIDGIKYFHKNIDGIKYFHSLGLPWCLDSSRNTHLLSKIACYNDLEDVRWAYENGCKGGNVVPYVKEEWKGYGIRDSSKWKANKVFFVENELLDEVILEKSGIKKVDATNVQEIGDAYLESSYDWFLFDYTFLKTFVDHGYMFASQSLQKTVCIETYKRYCDDSNDRKEEYRKRLALFVGMGVRMCENSLPPLV